MHGKAHMHTRLFSFLRSLRANFDTITYCQAVVASRASLALKVCTATNNASADASLEWVVGGMLCQTLRLNKPITDLSASKAKDQSAEFLLQRRVKNELFRRCRMKDIAQVEYEKDRRPTQMVSLFQSWAVYHSAFPRGKTFEDPRPLTAADTAVASAPTADPRACLVLFPSHYAKLIDEAVEIMDLSPKWGPFIKAFAASNPAGEADAVFVKAKARNIFDIELLVTEFATFEMCGVEPRRADATEEPRSTPMPVECEVAQNDDGDKTDAANDALLGEPEVCIADNAAAFKLLHLTPSVRNRFNSVPAGEFNEMYEDCDKHFRWIRWLLRPADGDYMRSLQTTQFSKHSNVLYNIDHKGGLLTQKRTMREPFGVPPFAETECEQILSGLFGPKAMAVNEREQLKTFNARGTSDVLALHSGRSLTVHLKQRSMGSQFTKNVNGMAKRIGVPKRLMYHNREFTHPLDYPSCGMSYKKNDVPVEALESIVFVARKDRHFSDVTRTFVDSGSLSTATGMQSVPLVARAGIQPLVLPAVRHSMFSWADDAATAQDAAAAGAAAAVAATASAADAAASCDEADDGDGEVVEADASDTEGDEGDENEEDEDAPRFPRMKKACRLFPWGACEPLLRELERQVGPSATVWFHGSNGAEAVMAARKRQETAIFCLSAEHVEFQREVVRATVLNEQLQGIDDGFLSRRSLAAFACSSAAEHTNMSIRIGVRPVIKIVWHVTMQLKHIVISNCTLNWARPCACNMEASSRSRSVSGRWQPSAGADARGGG